MFCHEVDNLATLTAGTNVSQNEPKVPYLREKKPFPYNPWWIITSFLVVVVISLTLYVVPNWVFLETWTRDLVVIILNNMGIPAHATGCADGFCQFPYTPSWSVFGEASPNTPGGSIVNTQYPAYWIVKACTGFQAGSILIALIIITPTKSKTLPANVDPATVSAFRRFQSEHTFIYTTIHKALVIMIFWFVLFITNALRIVFHLWLVAAFQIPFAIAHDDLSKVIGFFGTLFFAWVIEKSGIAIIDTFADWMDAAYLAIKAVVTKVI